MAVDQLREATGRDPVEEAIEVELELGEAERRPRRREEGERRRRAREDSEKLLCAVRMEYSRILLD
jgi:hypothetical protein